MSSDGRRLAFTRQSLTAPADLFVQAWPQGAPRQLTHVGRDFPLAKLVRFDRVSWPSRDGKFTIHGLLLTPRSAWSGEGASSRVAARLPTLVYHHGGPSMVSAAFAADGQGGAMLPLAARGYAVLAPNTRGRTGFGHAFRRGMRDGPSSGQQPYEDAMAGLDDLIERGIADPDRLGVYGHSYGGYLTVYSVTQTTRFRAAIVHEAPRLSLDRLTSAVGYTVPGTDWALLEQDTYGIGIRDPFESSEQARLLSESPIFNIGRVVTPTLLHYGKVNARDAGRELFGALQRRGVPSELRVYDEGHVFRRPAAIADDLTRIAAWFDYWIRGETYPDSSQVQQYDAWQAARRAHRRGQ